ncbi:MAG: MBL fold metallo-hydrolase [Oscillospiraceae bacterium]|nr:MBL fold metallo-hydrolase [Oscillospiraceae bacterium]
MRILTLIENTRASKKLYCEHGLSFYIELNGKAIVMDTGASNLFLKNAEKLQVDFSSTKAIEPLLCVISHNHTDHTGGLEPLLKLRPDTKVFAKKDVQGNYYRRVGPLSVSLCWNRNFLSKYKQNFVLFEQFQEVCEGFYVMGCEVFNEKHMLHDRRLLMKKQGKRITRLVPDDFKHEVFAVVFPHFYKSSGKPRRDKGCVVISSCSHSGIVNILETVKLTWPESPILGVIGGFHMDGLLGATEGYIKRTSTELMRLSDGCIYTCHCTGEKAYERLKSHMGDQLQSLKTGEELIF